MSTVSVTVELKCHMECFLGVVLAEITVCILHEPFPDVLFAYKSRCQLSV